MYTETNLESEQTHLGASQFYEFFAPSEKETGEKYHCKGSKFGKNPF